MYLIFDIELQTTLQINGLVIIYQSISQSQFFH